MILKDYKNLLTLSVNCRFFLGILAQVKLILLIFTLVFYGRDLIFFFKWLNGNSYQIKIIHIQKIKNECEYLTSRKK